MALWFANLGTKNQPKVFLHKVFLRTLQLMDVRGFGSRTSSHRKLYVPALRTMGRKLLALDVRPDVRPGSPRDIPLKSFLFGYDPCTPSQDEKLKVT